MHANATVDQGRRSRQLAASFLVLSAVFFMGAAAHEATKGGARSATEILEHADAIRNPSESFRMRAEVKTGEDTSEFEVQTKGKDKTLVKTLAPSRDVGRNMLMLDENMWAYIPNLKRAVRIGLNQKLTGQAA